MSRSRLITGACIAAVVVSAAMPSNASSLLYLNSEQVVFIEDNDPNTYLADLGEDCKIAVIYSPFNKRWYTDKRGWGGNAQNESVPNGYAGRPLPARHAVPFDMNVRLKAFLDGSDIAFQVVPGDKAKLRQCLEEHKNGDPARTKITRIVGPGLQVGKHDPEVDGLVDRLISEQKSKEEELRQECAATGRQLRFFGDSLEDARCLSDFELMTLRQQMRQHRERMNQESERRSPSPSVVRDLGPNYSDIIEQRDRNLREIERQAEIRRLEMERRDREREERYRERQREMQPVRCFHNGSMTTCY